MALDPNPKETAMSTIPASISFTDSTQEEIEAFLTKGYGADRLREVFGFIQDDGNWKLPVDVKITPSVKSILQDDQEILAAIDFMAGGGGTIEVLDDGTRHVKAPGYYAQIGS